MYAFSAPQRAIGIVGTGLSVGLLAWGCTQMPVESRPSAGSERRLAATVATDTTGYETAPPRDPNGIGTYYLGRQIAHVMGHEGASWLERSGRRQEEGTDILLRELRLKPTDVVADIGAGTGFFSFQLARRVPRGAVLAVDIQPEMIAALQATKQKLKLRNVRPVLGTTTNPALPADSVDLVLIVDAYHEFDHPREMGRAIRRAVAPRHRPPGPGGVPRRGPQRAHQAHPQDEHRAGPPGNGRRGPGADGFHRNPAPAAPAAVSEVT